VEPLDLVAIVLVVVLVRRLGVEIIHAARARTLHHAPAMLGSTGIGVVAVVVDDVDDAWSSTPPSQPRTTRAHARSPVARRVSNLARILPPHFFLSDVDNTDEPDDVVSGVAAAACVDVSSALIASVTPSRCDCDAVAAAAAAVTAPFTHTLHSKHTPNAPAALESSLCAPPPVRARLRSFAINLDADFFSSSGDVMPELRRDDPSRGGDGGGRARPLPLLFLRERCKFVT
jgi:hypothetical protein